MRRRASAREPVAYIARAPRASADIELAVDRARADPAARDRAARRGRRSSCRAGARVADVGTGSGRGRARAQARAARPATSPARDVQRRRGRGRARERRAARARRRRSCVADLLDGRGRRLDARRLPTRPTSPTATGASLAPEIARHEPRAALVRRRRRARRRSAAWSPAPRRGARCSRSRSAPAQAAAVAELLATPASPRRVRPRPRGHRARRGRTRARRDRPRDAATFERCIAVGGVALFPADTVYGLACEPDDARGRASGCTRSRAAAWTSRRR